MKNFTKPVSIVLLLILSATCNPAYGKEDASRIVTARLTNQTDKTIYFEFKNDDNSRRVAVSVPPKSSQPGSGIAIENTYFPGLNCNVITIRNKAKQGKMCQFCLVMDFKKVVSYDPITLIQEGIYITNPRTELQQSHNTLRCNTSSFIGTKPGSNIKVVNITLHGCD